MTWQRGFKAVLGTLGWSLVFLTALWCLISTTVMGAFSPNLPWYLTIPVSVLVVVATIGTISLGLWISETQRQYYRDLMSVVREAMSLRRQAKQLEVIEEYVSKDSVKYRTLQNLRIYR